MEGGLWLFFGGEEEIGPSKECKLGWLKRQIEKGIRFFGIYFIQFREAINRMSKFYHISIICTYLS